MKVQDQTLTLVSEQLVDAKEERKRKQKKESPVAVLANTTKATQPKKRTKTLVDSDDNVEVSVQKQMKSTVIVQQLFHALHISQNLLLLFSIRRSHMLYRQ